MLKVTILEFFIRFVPESFLVIIAGNIFANKRIERTPLIISGVILSISIYLIRMLPILFGVHTVLGAAVAAILFIVVNKIPVTRAISSTFVIIIILGISETLNLIFIQEVLKVDIQKILANPVEKVLYFIPSMLIVVCNIILFYIVLKKIKNRK